MPKSSKLPTAPSPDIAAALWGVSVEYVLDGRGNIVASGETIQKRYLGIRENHKVLLSSYAEISTAEEALEFVRHAGFPVFRLPHRASIPVRDILDSAAFIRCLRSVATTLQQGDTTALPDWVHERRRQEQYHIDFVLTDENGDSPKVFHTIPGGKSWFSPDDPLDSSGAEIGRYKYDRKVWEGWKKERLAHQYVAQAFLAQQLDKMLAGIQPAFHWMQEEGGRRWLSVPGLTVNSPWSAICLALYDAVVGGAGMRKCRRKGCNRFFASKNSKKEFCGGAHQRDCHRHPELLETR